MPDFLIYLPWERDADGYEILPEVEGQPWEGLLTSSARPQRIVPRGGPLIPYQPLELPALYSRFANVHTADDLLSFVNQYGALTERGQRRDYGEDVPWLLEHAQAFRNWLADRQDARGLYEWIGEGGQRIAWLEAVLVQHPASGGVRLQFRPPALLGALWLQLMLNVTGDRPYRECAYCGLWFEVGPGTGRRLDAKFCTSDHQVHFNRRKASRGRNANA